VGFAAKLVRGAYMYKERLLAAKSRTPDPVHDNYEATSAAYDGAISYLMEKMAKSSSPNRFRMAVAGHNEASALAVVKKCVLRFFNFYMYENYPN
jgi:hypothetical protein